MPFWFFTSYARADYIDEPYMGRFFNDLRNEVRNISGGPFDQIGFVDIKNIETGAEWEPVLAKALETSRVCVSLCSQSYFNSTYCGKEYEIFLRRRETIASIPGNESNRLIFPVIWVPPKQTLPQAVSRFQFADADFPESYAKEGLRYIMKLTRFKDDYEQFVSRLAEKIVEAGDDINISLFNRLPPLRDVPSAFCIPVHSAGCGDGSITPSSPNNARFAFFVGNRAEVCQHKASVGGYHETTAWFWQPYYPHDDVTVGLVAQEVASKLKLRYLELELHENIVEQLRELEKNNEVVVVVADAWSMRLPRCAQLLKEYDEAMLANCAVLVSWNDSDPETVQHRETLEQEIHAILPRKRQMCPPLHHWDTIGCGRDLREKLEKTLTEARMALLRFAYAQRRAESAELRQAAEQQGISLLHKPELAAPEGSIR